MHVNLAFNRDEDVGDSGIPREGEPALGAMHFVQLEVGWRELTASNRRAGQNLVKPFPTIDDGAVRLQMPTMSRPGVVLLENSACFS